ncbi:MAG: RodZ domain-containing protein [Candidatus Omnitrophota bacterium]
MSTPKEIGKLFCEAREKEGMTLAEAGTKSRIHLRVIKDIETGIFDRIGRPYLKSFMKKYADFLGMDVEEILRRYEMASSNVPAKEFTLNVEEKEKKEEEIFFYVKKNIKKNAGLVLFAGLMILIFILMGLSRGGREEAKVKSQKSKVKSLKSDRAEDKKNNPKDKSKKQEAEGQETKAKSEAQIEKIKEKGTEEKIATSKAALTLTLAARDKAWIHVTEGEKLLFSGILEKGTSKTWESEGRIDVWTGKAEMLDFTVNDKDMGKIASGVVKNIKVSPEGVKVGKTWAARID